MSYDLYAYRVPPGMSLERFLDADDPDGVLSRGFTRSAEKTCDVLPGNAKPATVS